MKNKFKNFKIKWVVLFLIFFLSFVLFYSQITTSYSTMYPLKYGSDLQVHVQMAYLGIFYSLMGTIFKLILVLGGEYSKILISILLSSFIIFSIFETEKIFDYLLKKFNISIRKIDIFYLSSFLLFIIAIYVPKYNPIFFGKFFTKSVILITSMSAQPWHNATYNGMRLFALKVIYKYLYITNESNIKLKDYIEFLILLLLVNAIKPNFIIAFAPMVLMFLIYDSLSSLLTKKYLNKKKALFLANCVVISTVVLYSQYKVLFPSESGNNFSFTLEIFKVLILEKNFYMITLLGIIFPIFVLVYCIKSKYTPKILFQSWVLFFISFSQRLFFTETGYREKHGNFYWGGYFAGYFLFLVSLVLVITLYKKKLISKKIFNGLLSLFFMHVFSGIIYFLILLKGTHILI